MLSCNTHVFQGHLIADPDFDVEFHKISSSHVITFSCYFTVENFGEEGNVGFYSTCVLIRISGCDK